MRTLLVLTTGFVIETVLALPALAAEAAEGGKKQGLLDIDIYAMASAVVIFVVLLLVLTKFAWKPILTGLKKREDTIQNALDDAKAANEQARDLITQYETKLDAAREEAASIAEEARKDAQDIKAQIQASAKQSADETVARAKVEIEQASAKAWDQIVRDAASIATDAAGRIVAGKLSPEGHAEIVASVVSEFADKRRGA